MPFPTRGTSCLSTLLVALFACVVVVALGAPPAGAQQGQTMPQGQAMASDDMSKPAPILVIYKEDVKAGHVYSHDQLEANFARTYAKMPGARYYLAMNSVTGPNQAWESEANQKAPVALRTSLRQISSGENENLTEQRAITTVYREDLSYNASMKNLPQSRYCEVVTYKVKPGHESDFMEAAKLVRATYEKAHIPMQWATYEVFAGAESGTFYVFRAMDSLAKADPTQMDKMEAFHTALGEEGGKRLMELVSNGIVSRELNFYSFNPQTSFAPPDFVTADAFWAPTPQAGSMAHTVATTGKTPEKPVKPIKKQ